MGLFVERVKTSGILGARIRIFLRIGPFSYQYGGDW
jgi:hypothetical protein